MAKLSCNVTNCIHNGGGLCGARVIHIIGKEADTSRGTECDTFEDTDITAAIRGMTNINIGGQLRQAFENEKVVVSPDITCEAKKCIYNADRRCTAEYVQIYGPASLSNSYTRCESFKDR
ncbi:DUF1540 domain-containing protein [Clostridium sp. MSJ-4]|uniref:DUF1540 domain-containing protein n=1 Tax=Clostridium simiarum TaxID=2841506 RepID=A0ABS6F281_9CLOT|nr:DUF1540 domain-containing protein [Clostridium simiarum]MBU5592611.1 DUF1540 domain-containing protein [Clostridium simiarum]